jgi:hypothetical protein
VRATYSRVCACVRAHVCVCVCVCVGGGVCLQELVWRQVLEGLEERSVSLGRAVGAPLAPGLTVPHHVVQKVTFITRRYSPNDSRPSNVFENHVVKVLWTSDVR